jgi:hypothetical protein
MVAAPARRAYRLAGLLPVGVRLTGLASAHRRPAAHGVDLATAGIVHQMGLGPNGYERQALLIK